MKRISHLAVSLLAAFGVPTAAGCHASVLDAVDNSVDTGATYKKVQLIASKVDLLFVVDNSSSMGDKQAYLQQAVPAFVGRLVHPNCVDAANGTVVGTTDDHGACSAGRPEFRPVDDLHIGVISSSLGGRGSSSCKGPDGNTVYPTHNDDGAHLLSRAGRDEHALADALPGHFLAWKASGGGTGVADTPAGISDSQQLISDVTDLISGVHEHGCGFEAQLESMYRFLVQPDPYATLVGGFNGTSVATSSPVSLSGVDGELLAMRRAFLRPDSLVAIVLLTDENDSTVDPRAFGGRAWEFEQASPVQGGTAVCATSPEDPECTSCRLQVAQGDPACRQGQGTVPDGDAPSVRFFQMKRRFGVDPQFPIDRYVRGLTQASVPDREGEHPSGSFEYVGNADCTNPLFAADLPADPTADLCLLKPGPRRPESGLVYLTVIGGVPWQLLTTNPTDFSNGNKAPFKPKLDAADYTRILGKDPLRYDFTGLDPHMQESITARQLGADDAHGREWDTRGRNLQYACVFDLPAPKDCDAPDYAGACDCDTAENAGTDAPVCASQSALQTKGKAFPSVRELVLARELGDQAIVGSICPRPGDGSIPTPGYLPTLRQLVDRASASLAR